MRCVQSVEAKVWRKQWDCRTREEFCHGQHRGMLFCYVFSHTQQLLWLAMIVRHYKCGYTCFSCFSSFTRRPFAVPLLVRTPHQPPPLFYLKNPLAPLHLFSCPLLLKGRWRTEWYRVQPRWRLHPEDLVFEQCWRRAERRLQQARQRPIQILLFWFRRSVEGNARRCRTLRLGWKWRGLG